MSKYYHFIIVGTSDENSENRTEEPLRNFGDNWPKTIKNKTMIIEKEKILLFLSWGGSSAVWGVASPVSPPAVTVLYIPNPIP